MNLTLYDFSKRVNSTAIPGSGTTIDVVLKDNCDLYNPIFLLNGIDYKNYNYCKWDSRYYYIEEVTYTNKTNIMIQCTIDVLATWRSEIMSSTAFILYSTNSYDVGLIDTRLSADISTITSSSSVSPFSDASAYYVVGYVGQHTGTSNPCVALNSTGIRALQNVISSSAFAEFLFTGEIENALSKLLNNCGDAITSCKRIPICYTSGSVSVILSGGYETGITGYEPSQSHDVSTSISIPWNFSTGDFRNRSQFTSLLLYLPSYGYVELNADDYQGSSSISISILVNSTTGDISYKWRTGKADANCGAPYQISTTTSTANIGSLSSGVGSLASLASGNLGAIGGVFNSILSNMGHNVGSCGSVGSTASYDVESSIILYCISHDTNQTPSSMGTNFGRPLNKVSNIPNSGYVECANASVDCDAPLTLKEQINNYLNGGVYIE